MEQGGSGLPSPEPPNLRPHASNSRVTSMRRRSGPSKVFTEGGQPTRWFALPDSLRSANGGESDPGRAKEPIIAGLHCETHVRDVGKLAGVGCGLQFALGSPVRIRSPPQAVDGHQIPVMTWRHRKNAVSSRRHVQIKLCTCVVFIFLLR
jgi:hypothetical protein